MEGKIISSIPVTSLTHKTYIRASSILKRSVYVSLLEANSMLRAAQQDAKAIVVQAETERDRIRARAREEGYQEGLRHWNRIVLEFEERKQQGLAELEPLVIKLAVQIAEKIIGESARQDPGAMAGIVRQARSYLVHSNEMVIRVNPRLVAGVQENLDLLQAKAGTQRRISVVGNPALAEGDCVIESELGIVDARLSTQLKCLENVLLEQAKR